MFPGIFAGMRSAISSRAFHPSRRGAGAYAYYTNDFVDAVTRRLRVWPTTGIPVVGLTDAQAARRIERTASTC